MDCKNVLGFVVFATLLISCKPSTVADSGSDPDSGPDEESLLDIAAHGYFSWGEKSWDVTGILVHEPEAAWQGLNFFLPSNRPEALLMDMEGEILHRWLLDIEEAFPGGVADGIDTYWRRAALLTDGSVIGIHDHYGMVKLDCDSRVVWAKKNKAHHALDFDKDGNFYVICGKVEEIPRLGEGGHYTDYVRKYSPEAELLDSISIDQAYKDSSYPVHMPEDYRLRGRQFDVYHTNSLKVLDGSLADHDPAFKEGNILLFFRPFDEIAVLDPDARKIVWLTSGPWERAHEPVPLAPDRMLIFDNYGGHTDEAYSRVVEFDPLTIEIFWSFEGREGDPLKSPSRGSVARLPNGNTLITESAAGRALEVTPDKRVVWEFILDENDAERTDRVSVLQELIRIDREVVAEWLPTQPDAESLESSNTESPPST